MTFQHLNLQCNISMKNLITKTQLKEFQLKESLDEKVMEIRN